MSVPFSVQFTLMCYNILCEKYASPQIYPYCPAWALNWVFRRAAIMDELRLYSADIICLQVSELAFAVIIFSSLTCHCVNDYLSCLNLLRELKTKLTSSSKSPD